jgi:hypothetical protein
VQSEADAYVLKNFKREMEREIAKFLKIAHSERARNG